VSRRLRWELPERTLPSRPYRDTLVLHVVLAGVIVVLAWATGGSLGRAFAVAAAFFVLATAWSFWRWRARLRGPAARAGERSRR
jgi:hypothetical protein